LRLPIIDDPSLCATFHALADAVVFICWVHVYLPLYGLGMLGLPGGNLYSIRHSTQLDLDVTSCACSPKKAFLPAKIKRDSCFFKEGGG
jgi:hypothetical protein